MKHESILLNSAEVRRRQRQNFGRNRYVRLASFILLSEKAATQPLGGEASHSSVALRYAYHTHTVSHTARTEGPFEY